MLSTDVLLSLILLSYHGLVRSYTGVVDRWFIVTLFTDLFCDRDEEKTVFLSIMVEMYAEAEMYDAWVSDLAPR